MRLSDDQIETVASSSWFTLETTIQLLKRKGRLVDDIRYVELIFVSS